MEYLFVTVYLVPSTVNPYFIYVYLYYSFSSSKLYKASNTLVTFVFLRIFLGKTSQRCSCFLLHIVKMCLTWILDPADFHHCSNILNMAHCPSGNFWIFSTLHASTFNSLALTEQLWKLFLFPISYASKQLCVFHM